jgi:protein-L-isoaspartate O-methyltransferase
VLHKVFSAVARHEFVPHFFEQLDMWQWARIDGTSPSQRDRWLAGVYSDTTLVTALLDVALPEEHGGGAYPVAVSSSTAPGLMAHMLEELALEDGHRTLEIGTGTGYNAALLSERLGDRQVCSIDLRPKLVETARDRLATAGYQPTLAVGDGADGLPDDGPFDRIIATCCVQHVPPAWIEQLRPGGLLLADVEGPIAGGNLIALRRVAEDLLQGRFRTQYGGFMPMQHQLGVNPGNAPPLAGHPRERVSPLSPQVVHQQNHPEQLFVQLHLPSGTQLHLSTLGSTTTTRLIAPDGSWCEVTGAPESNGHHHVTEAGQNNLWHLVETAHQRYIALGEPSWDRFGVSASPTAQHLWLDSPDSDLNWPISLAGPP